MKELPGGTVTDGKAILQQLEDAQATPGTARWLAGDYNREEVDAATIAAHIKRTVTGRIPSRGPGFIVPGEYREIDYSHLAPYGGYFHTGMTRSRYQAEAIRNGDLTIMKGTSVGLTMSWAAPDYGVNICDVCGCVHRSHHGYICNSCFDGIQRVGMKQAMDRFLDAANKLAQAFRDAGNALGDCQWYGPPPLQMLVDAQRGVKRYAAVFPTEPDARRFAMAHIDPVVIGPRWVHDELLTYEPARAPNFDDFMTGMVDSIAATFDIPRSVLLTPTPFPRGNDFSDILRHYGMECPRPAVPVMARNKRNRGPEQHGKWWNKRR